MNEHFFADVELPFHVWVREPSGSGAFAWVLRQAPSLQDDGLPHAGRQRDPGCGVSAAE